MLKKVFSAVAMSFAIALATTGCGSVFDSNDEEELAPFKIKESGVPGGSIAPVDPNAVPGGSGDAHLQGVDPNAGDQPGPWGNTALSSDYADFGTPIPGLTLPTVYFKFDQSRIDSSEFEKLDKIAAYLMSNPGTGVVVEGNCDSKGSDEYNRALGERRALAAKDYLLSKGIAENRIRTISYGEERPAVPGEDENACKMNRRDDFVGVTLKK